MYWLPSLQRINSAEMQSMYFKAPADWAVNLMLSPDDGMANVLDCDFEVSSVLD